LLQEFYNFTQNQSLQEEQEARQRQFQIRLKEELKNNNDPNNRFPHVQSTVTKIDYKAPDGKMKFKPRIVLGSCLNISFFVFYYNVLLRKSV
jgi:hypothetical protein